MPYAFLMRVLFHTYDLAFRRMGGGERVILSLREALRAQGVEAELYDPWRHDPRHFSLLHYFSSRQTEFWPYFTKNFDLPLVVTPTLPTDLGLSWKQRLVSRVSRRKLADRLSHPHHFLPTTSREAAYLETLGVASRRMTVLPNGLAPGIAAGEGRSLREKLGVKNKLVLCVGRFEPVKNQLGLIRALGRVGGVDCLFLGDADPGRGSYYARCRAEAARAARVTFHFHPSVPQSDPFLADAYAAADLYVQPSRFETFGMAALEAHAAGCALALTKNMASPELFPGAVFFDPLDDKRSEAALRGALRMERAPGPRAAVVDNFSWPKIGSELKRIYADILQWNS